MSTHSPAHTTDPSSRWQEVTPSWRATPPLVWVLAAGWAVACWALMGPWLPVWAHTAEGRWTGDSVRDFTVAVVLATWPLMSAAIALAPAVTLLVPRLGLCLALVGLVPAMGGLEGIAGQFSGYLSLVGVAALWSWRRARVNWVALALALLPPGLFCFSHGLYDLVLAGVTVSSQYWLGRGVGEPLTIWAMYLLGALALVALGWLTCRHSRLELLARQQLAADRAAVAHQRVAVRNEAAAVDERARLARDLHDIVAHRISLVAVRAETAPYAHPEMDAPTRQVFAEIAADARTVMDEMRQVLGVLHRSQDGGARAPQPGVADLAQLVDEVRAVGLDVTVAGGLPSVPESTGVVVYRVVQEALTNARRHGQGPVVLELGGGQGDVVVTVTNPCDLPGPVVAGRGLSGMRERLALVGGTLDTHVADDHFVLTARISELPHD